MAHGGARARAKDFAAPLAARETVTGAVVARIWAKWFGDRGAPQEPISAMEDLAADLQALPGQLVG